MIPVRIEITDKLARAVEASLRLRRQTPDQWLRAAVRDRLVKDVCNLRPFAERMADEDNDEVAVRALIAIVEELD